jgi:TRAP-type C4-dicarboxylate transport system permease small subunit
MVLSGLYFAMIFTSWQNLSLDSIQVGSFVDDASIWVRFGALVIALLVLIIKLIKQLITISTKYDSPSINNQEY